MATNGTGTELSLTVKEQVVDDTPRVIKGLQFGVLSVETEKDLLKCNV